MTYAVSALDATRYFGGVLLVGSLPYLMFDSLSKTVDVIKLKEKLDLKEARLHSILVDQVEKAIAPYVGSELASIGDNLGLDSTFSDNGPAHSPHLSETAKDSLVKVVRNCEPVWSELSKIRQMPKTLALLNRVVYILVFCLAIAAAIAIAATYLLPDNHVVLFRFALSILIALFLTALGFAVRRQFQGQDAEQAVIHEDPQPRA